MHLERSSRAAATEGAGRKNLSLGLRSPSRWCREQFRAPSMVLSSSWWCCATRLSWHQGTGTVRGLTVSLQWPWGNGTGHVMAGESALNRCRVHPKPFATHLIVWGKGEQLVLCSQGPHQCHYCPSRCGEYAGEHICNLIMVNLFYFFSYEVLSPGYRQRR